MRVARYLHTQAMASGSIIFGTVACAMAGMLAAVVMWRLYGRPNSTEDLQAASAQISKQYDSYLNLTRTVPYSLFATVACVLKGPLVSRLSRSRV